MLIGHDINLHLVSMRKALKQCLISRTIILAVVSETILRLNVQYTLSGVCEGLCNTQFYTQYPYPKDILPCHIIYNWMLKIEFLICSSLVNLGEEVII